MIGRAPQQGQGIGMPDFFWLNGLAGGNNRWTQSVTAFAGGGQANGTIIGAPNSQGIEAALVEIRTVAVANDSCQLPQAVAGKTLLVFNSSANSANLYANPNTNKATGTKDVINAGVNTDAYAVAGGVSVALFCPRDGIWGALKSA